MPSKVQLEIVLGDQLIDVIDVIIPGGHVKTLTSASRLIKVYEFSKKQHFIDEQKLRGLDLEKEEALMSNDEKAMIKKQLPKIEA